MTAGLGAGAGGAPSQAQYEVPGGGMPAQTVGGPGNVAGGEQYGGGNNREFQSGYEGPTHGNTDGPSPVPDQMYSDHSGPGTGLPSTSPQRLP